MYLNVRLNENDDKDLIDDVERFTGNKKFTRSDRVKELMRIGRQMEQKSMAVMLSTGRATPSSRPEPTRIEEPRKTASALVLERKTAAVASNPGSPLVNTKSGWQRLNIFTKQ